MTEISCCFSGHRAEKLPWKWDESDSRCLDLKSKIAESVHSVYDAGFQTFYCGMATGCDMYYCEELLTMKKNASDIRIIAAVPFPGQSNSFPAAIKERYINCLAQCDQIFTLSDHYTPDCMMKRNRFMVDHSELLIACFDGQHGGTFNTIRYARQKGIQTILIGIN